MHIYIYIITLYTNTNNDYTYIYIYIYILAKMPRLSDLSGVSLLTSYRLVLLES